MDNRILDVQLEDHSLDPVSAEVRILVRAEQLTPTTEVRGRLVGPSCPFASTVEVAYPLRPLRRSELSVPGTVALRVVIPEASLWDTQSPHLYVGPVELWQDGRRCDRVELRHGLRRLSLGPQGLRLNGRPLTLRGRSDEARSQEQALVLHDERCNALLVQLFPDDATTWDVADRFGFLVIGRLPLPNEETVRRLQSLSCRPSCFGWIVGSEWLAGEWLSRLAQVKGSGPFVGVEGEPDATKDLPNVQFVVGRRDQLPALLRGGRPVLLIEEPGERSNLPNNAPPLLGHVESGTPSS
ncbi:MAG: hypothetical protein HYS12_10980 [Planctomycetes bacterium]|nr:hypothetical protein [Planctomycetota bacterium]